MPSAVSFAYFFGRKTLIFLESKGFWWDSSTFNFDGPIKQTQKIIYLLKDVTRQGHLRAVLARSNNPARPHYLLAEPCLTTHAHISWKQILSFGRAFFLSTTHGHTRSTWRNYHILEKLFFSWESPVLSPNRHQIHLEIIKCFALARLAHILH